MKIGMQYMCAALMVICWLLATATESPAADPKAVAILTQQSAYFQKIASLEFSVKTTRTVNQALQEKRKGPGKERNEMRLVFSGAKYYSKTSFYEGDAATPKSTTITAYDGITHQEVSGGGTLFIRKGKPQDPSPYGGWIPFTAPFGFAYEVGDEISIVPLMSPAKWSQLAEEVVSVEDNVTMFGHTGCKLAFKKPSGRTFEVLFASDLDYFPVYSKADFGGGASGELRVLKTVRVPDVSGGMVVPTSLSVDDYSNDKVYVQQVLMEVDVKTLKVNQSLREDAFTIPRSEAKRVYDSDLEKIVN